MQLKLQKLTTLNKKKPSQKEKNVCLKFYVKRDLNKKTSTLHGSNIPENFINKTN